MTLDDAALSPLFGQHLEVLEQHTAAALKDTGHDALLLHSGIGPMVFRDDQPYPFRANAPFKRWVPLSDVAECLLYFEPGRRPLLLLHSPTDYWYKSASMPLDYWTPWMDIELVADRAAARSALPRSLDRAAYVGEPFDELAQWGAPWVNPEPLLRRLDYQRAFKTPYERACILRANQIGARAHLAAARAFADGASEFEIQLEFLRASQLREEELPYNSIIACNENAAVLHYQRLERAAPSVRHSLLIDAGASFAGYASDITRTYSYSDGDFAALIGRMDEVQQSLCSSVRAGVDWRHVHLSAHSLIAELLHDADFIHCDADEAVETGISSVFLPHGVGHLLGLQVHDVGGLMRTPEGGEIERPDGHPYLRLTRVLEENFVVTMEPGIYFIEELLNQARADARSQKINWQRVEAMRRFGGIRIEDDLAVDAEGCQNLTRESFSAAAADPGSPGAVLHSSWAEQALRDPGA